MLTRSKSGVHMHVHIVIEDSASSKTTASPARKKQKHEQKETEAHCAQWKPVHWGYDSPIAATEILPTEASEN
jgi:hypothetical protein